MSPRYPRRGYRGRVLRARPAAAVLAAASLAAALAMGGAAAASTPALEPGGTLVALGDSYIAGIGAGDYWERDGCRRSAVSYPARVAALRRAALVDLTCPGAVIADVDKRLPLVPAGADVVLVEVGGNDVGFGRVAAACVVGGTSSCVSAADEARAKADRLPSRLAPLLSRIRAAAPRARVIAAGYPALIGTVAACREAPVSTLLTPPALAALRSLQGSLDAAVRRAARAAGVGSVDWPRTVDRHSLCSADPWYVLPGAGRFDDLLHPTDPAVRDMAAHLDTSLHR